MIRKHKNKIMGASVALVVLIAVVFFVLSTREKNVAIVNGERITKTDFDRIYEKAKSKNPDIDKMSVINIMISNKLILQEASKKFTASDDEIDKVIRFTEMQYNIKADDILKSENLTIGEFRKTIMEQLIASKFINETFGNITLTDDEFDDFYEQNKEKLVYPKEVNVSHILVNMKDEADSIKKEIDGGADFHNLAMEKSTDKSSATKGGNVGFVKKGDTVKEFEDVIFNMEKGIVSDVFKSRFGYHIALVEDIKEERQIGKKEAKELLYNQVLDKKRVDEVNNFVRDLGSKSEIKIIEKNL